jgi:hypothetical protein
MLMAALKGSRSLIRSLAPAWFESSSSVVMKGLTVSMALVARSISALGSLSFWASWPSHAVAACA